MENLPEHVAIVPDGNRRWSKLHGLTTLEGHQAGADAMHNVVDSLVNYQVKYLTLWGFSTDNWKRSQTEIDDLFTLLEWWILKDTPWLNSRGVRLLHIGRLRELPQDLQLAIKKAGDLTAGNTGMTLNLAFNYSGRAEIVDAVNRLLAVGIDHIDEEVLRFFLYTNGMPDVDLVIRTAGDFRLSNFLLWQTAYSEYYFTDILWPDFNSEELEEALQEYDNRQRRFGGD